MALRDRNDRFDYLFEPIDGPALPADAEIEQASSDAPTDPRRRKVTLLLGSATILGAVVGLVLLLVVWPERDDTVTTNTPAPSATTSSSAPATATTSQTAPSESSQAPEPAPAPPPSLSSDAPSPLPAQPQPQPAPAPEPASPSPVAPQQRSTPTPTVRAPLSVSPQPRPAFPNQTPPSGSDRPGGLLPGLGGVL